MREGRVQGVETSWLGIGTACVLPNGSLSLSTHRQGIPSFKHFSKWLPLFQQNASDSFHFNHLPPVPTHPQHTQPHSSQHPHLAIRFRSPLFPKYFPEGFPFHLERRTGNLTRESLTWPAGDQNGGRWAKHFRFLTFSSPLLPSLPASIIAHGPFPFINQGPSPASPPHCCRRGEEEPQARRLAPRGALWHSRSR